MKIAGSEIEMRSNRYFDERDEVMERWTRGSHARIRRAGPVPGESLADTLAREDRVEISEEARGRYRAAYSTSTTGEAMVWGEEGGAPMRRLTAGSTSEVYAGTVEGSRFRSGVSAAVDGAGFGGASEFDGGVVRESRNAFRRIRGERRREMEHTNFDASGTVVTEDGRQIDLDVAMAMRREFSSETVSFADGR